MGTYQCLKPLVAISEAQQCQAIVQDWAILLPDDQRPPGNRRGQALAFSLSEVAAPFGGLSAVQSACGACPANLSPNPEFPIESAAGFPPASSNPESGHDPEHQVDPIPASGLESRADRPPLAGCCQWLLMGRIQNFSQQTRELSFCPQPLARPTWTAYVLEHEDAAVQAVMHQVFSNDRLADYCPPPRTPAHLWHWLWQTLQQTGATQPLGFSSAASSQRPPSPVQAIAQPLSPIPTASGMPNKSRRLSPPTSGQDRQWFAGLGAAMVQALAPWLGGDTAIEGPTGWSAFCHAVERCQQFGWRLQLQSIPRGFSDGRDWWLGPHCSHCAAAMSVQDRQCHVCGQQAGPVPASRRRIMGWAPYRPLASLVESAQADRLMASAADQLPTG